MEITPFRRRGYTRLSSANRTKVKIVRFGTAGKRLWRAPRMKLKVRLPSPVKLWLRLKNAYVKMMLKLANRAGTSNSLNVFGTKRIPQARAEPMPNYSRTEFENRLVLEIYKSMVSSLELGYKVKN